MGLPFIPVLPIPMVGMLHHNSSAWRSDVEVVVGTVIAVGATAENSLGGIQERGETTELQKDF